MDETDLRLDGNAAAGLLAEVFGAEMTTALGTCATCGATNALGAAHLYMRGPGAVLRCPACTGMLLCVVRTPDGLVVDLSGIRRIRIEA
jgi:DNA-directed RNA polymerase subunit RPC12/RpoP